jgi:hypothetical protein
MNARRCSFVALLFLGCAPLGRTPVSATDPEESPSQFPSASDLDKLGGVALPAQVLNPDVRDPDTWTMQNPPAESPGEAMHTPGSPWESLLADAAQAEPGRFWTSEAMHCVAEQYAHFYLSQMGFPTNDLGQFMASRCGMTDNEIGAYVIGWQITSKTTDQEIFARTRDDFNQKIHSQLTITGSVAGAAFARNANHAVILLTHAPHRIRFDAAPLVPDPDGHVRLRGEVLIPGQFVEGLVNYGRFGFKTCVVEPGIAMPRFGLDCETNREDKSAAIEIGVFPPKHLVGRLVSDLVVWPAGNPAAQYERPSYGVEMRAPVDSHLPETLTSLLNEVRKTAGLPLVHLEKAESVTATALAPHYFASVMGSEPESAMETVVLGLRAGWQIPGFVGYGTFTSSVSQNLHDAGRLLLNSLGRPAGREVLLNPKSSVIAIGPVISQEAGMVGAVFSSYSFLDRSSTADEATEVFRALVLRRNQRGRRAPFISRHFEAAVTHAAHSLEVGKRTPSEAMQDALLNTQGATGYVQAWFLTTDQYERLTFPEDLLDQPSLYVAIGTAHYKPRNSPWAMRGVLILGTGGHSATAASDTAKDSRARE